MLNTKHISFVLCGIVDKRTLKTAQSLSDAGARVTIHALTYSQESYEDRSFEVRYHAPAEPKPSQLAWRPLRVFVNVVVNRYRRATIEKHAGVLGYKTIEHILLQEQPDCIVAVNADTLRGCADAARELGAKLIYEAYEFWPDLAYEESCWYNDAQREFLVKSEQGCIGQADAVVTVSDYIADALQEQYSIKKPYVIYNAPFGRIKKAAPAHDPLRLVWFGYLRHDIDPRPLISTMKHVDGAILTIQGEGLLQRDIEELIEREHLKEKVKLVPFVPYDQVVTSAAQHDVGIIAHTIRTRQMQGALPNKFFEYLAGGLAIVASDSATFRLFPGFDTFGVRFDPENLEQLREVLSRLASSPEVVSELKRQAVAHSEGYTAEKQTEKIVSIYETVLGERGIG